MKIHFLRKTATADNYFKPKLSISDKPTKLSDSTLRQPKKYFLIFESRAIANMKKRTTFATLFKGKSKVLKFGAVVQSVRISACHAGGREFESRPHRKKPD